ncbi:flagellar hook protein [Cryobacterium sp. LW097]|uniref:flagellar hook protein FlgE n=1 Tax=unclassified Cryobacterium TaxID=2649013 RepID=UPI000B4C91EA|nr:MULTISPECIES: flagellar hook protein FlgE [unclassified Cryobacterium]ASD21933.1 flagellar hook protein [Cryobacterium sp. LW097]TFC53490.1 flagellar hook protein FlgE [Cryobacterium sp. TMB3-1-2]TFC69157.1 flagellar hook protein FlgE [Cryobacterium sp. TMB3-15]TFC76045.1 flagellar hook protein FlgE [Cryobacterium sp. TMB3-10]TFC87029.1 flagellar hook protein FlgE [Cryobacterium sp. TMT4-31]
MLRSLYSGISGLRAHQTMLDVTGNNIANVNTTAFKGSATQFQDTLSQLTQGAGGPGATTGGTNPAQVGLGVQVAGIATNFAQGSSQATGKASDMLISGDGFFLTQQGGETIYTRAGSFDFDSAGRLVTPSGAIVQGWGAVDGVVNEGGAVGDLSLPLNAVVPGKATSSVAMSGTLPSDAVGGTQLLRDIKVYDASGAARTVSLTFTKAATGSGWGVSGTDGGTAATTTLGFTGNVVTSGGSLVIGDPAAGGITVDLSALNGLAGISTVGVKSQDGSAPGSLESYTFGKDGTLIGLFSNGEQKALGRIALATFTNPGGLEKTGSNGYRATFNSGTAELGAPGSAGLGSLTGGALEMSNVDLSQEFTNLIVAQRGFQANARIITTSDEVLQELTNLKR